MSLKAALIIAVICLTMGPSCLAQSLPAISDIGDIWNKNEKRTYLYLSEGKEIGTLEAALDDIDRVGDSTVYVFEEDIDLDLSSVNQPHLKINGAVTLSAQGHFLSGKYKVESDDRWQRNIVSYNAMQGIIKLSVDGERPTKQESEAPSPVYPMGNYVIDQIEILLAMHTLQEGDTIVAPYYSATDGYSGEAEFHVIGQKQIQYASFSDQVWQVDLIRPGQVTVYVDRNHRIVKMTIPSLHLTAELQKVTGAVGSTKSSGGEKSKSLYMIVDDIITRFPIYGIYLLFALIWLLFPGQGGFRSPWSYALFAVGGVLYPLIYVTQAPLQQIYIANFMTPALTSGGSIYPYAIIPVILTGLIQETLKLVPLILVARLTRMKGIKLIALGAFIGAGFGWLEACHLLGPMFQARTLTGYVLAERVFSILFHMTLGAGLGYGLARSRVWHWWLAAVGAHALGSYMIVFVQTGMMTIKNVNILLALYSVALLAGMMYLRRQVKLLPSVAKKG